MLTSIEWVFGSTHNDILTVARGGWAYGDAGDDTLSGSATGAPTDEVLIGGTGNDKFVLHLGFGAELIRDFKSGEDKLVVSAAEFNNVAFNYSFPFNNIVNNVTDGVLKTTAGASPQFIYDETTTTLYFDTDGTGNMGPIAIATLFSMHNLPLNNGGFFSSSDFLIV